MKRYRINLSGSDFERFIQEGMLYIDKTLFIEHVLEEPSDVLLITRPRRMGKSLNMNMLARYLDLKGKDGAVPAASLFAGLKIEGRPCFREHINRYPVIYLDFRFLMAENYRRALRSLLMSCVDKYLPAEQWTRDVKGFVDNADDFDSRNLFYLTENLHQVYGQGAVILIDEYDHVLMDNVGTPEYQDIRNYISAVFETALKGNSHLKKALLTGVLRVSQESMFSKLNNIMVYDVFTEGPFDEDFGLTEEEVRALVPPEQFAEVKNWYNNVHVGKRWMFYVYSLLSYLHHGEINNYWGQSGSMKLLGDLLTPSRVLQLGEAAKGLDKSFTAEVDPRVSLEAFFGNRFDKFYYAVAIQAGYLTFDREGGALSEKYRIRVPNEELLYVWRSYILSDIVNDPENQLGRIFAGIENLKRFSEDLSDFISFKLSCFDLEKNALEKTYHVFVFGMMLTLGYECASNREAGYGRYDLLVKAPQWTAAIEFKKAKGKGEKSLKEAAHKGLEQIYDKQYLAGAPGDRAAYAIGVGCYKERCVVAAERAGAAG